MGRGHQPSTYERLLADPKAKLGGPGVSAIKYDILTALLTTATHEDGPRGRLALRLSLIITARFNWRRGLFNIGLKELARLWGVTERTVKRDMALMRSLGWIRLERAAARGRVAQYGIDMARLLTDTMPHWEAVGPDFVERMTGSPEPAPCNVVPLRSAELAEPTADGTIWPQVAAHLMVQDGAVYAAWFSGLSVADCEGGYLTLTAPSQFVAQYVDTHLRSRLKMAVHMADRSIRDIRIISDQ